MPIGCLLTLSDGRERQFWADAGMQRQLRRLDALGLAAGVIVNTLHSSSSELNQWKTGREWVAVGGLLQLAQLAWLILRPQSYMRHRTVATIIQRLLRSSLALAQLEASEAVIFTMIPFQRPLQPGTLGAFLSVFCLIPA
jgi:hypothetical protein